MSSFDFDYQPREFFGINAKELNETFFKNRTFRQLMDELSYNDDLLFQFWRKDSKWTYINEGKNRITTNPPLQKEGTVEVELIKVPLVWQGGICYVLQFENVQNWTGATGHILIEYSKNLKVSDIPKSFTIYLTPR